MRIYSKAFTLIEILVVISIIGLLASIVMASLRGAKDKARVAAAQVTEKSLYSARGDRVQAGFKFDQSLTDSEGGGEGIVRGSGSPVYSPDTPYNDGYSLYFDEDNAFSISYPMEDLAFSEEEAESMSYTAGLWFKTDDLNGGLFDVFYNIDIDEPPYEGLNGYPSDRTIFLTDGR